MSDTIPVISSALTIVYIQKWLKQRQFYAKFVKAFPGADKYAHWIAAGIMSAVFAAGIHYTWMYDADSGGQVVISIPAVNAVVHGLIDWFKVYIIQHYGHDVTRHGPYNPDEVLAK
jgi:hypothetical protein